MTASINHISSFLLNRYNKSLNNTLKNLEILLFSHLLSQDSFKKIGLLALSALKQGILNEPDLEELEWELDDNMIPSICPYVIFESSNSQKPNEKNEGYESQYLKEMENSFEMLKNLNKDEKSICVLNELEVKYKKLIEKNKELEQSIEEMKQTMKEQEESFQQKIDELEENNQKEIKAKQDSLTSMKEQEEIFQQKLAESEARHQHEIEYLQKVFDEKSESMFYKQKTKLETQQNEFFQLNKLYSSEIQSKNKIIEAMQSLKKAMKTKEESYQQKMSELETKHQCEIKVIRKELEEAKENLQNLVKANKEIPKSPMLDLKEKKDDSQLKRSLKNASQNLKKPNEIKFQTKIPEYFMKEKPGQHFSCLPLDCQSVFSDIPSPFKQQPNSPNSRITQKKLNSSLSHQTKNFSLKKASTPIPCDHNLPPNSPTSSSHFQNHSRSVSRKFNNTICLTSYSKSSDLPLNISPSQSSVGSVQPQICSQVVLSFRYNSSGNSIHVCPLTFSFQHLNFEFKFEKPFSILVILISKVSDILSFTIKVKYIQSENTLLHSNHLVHFSSSNRTYKIIIPLRAQGNIQNLQAHLIFES